METSPDGDIDVEMEDGETRPDAVAPQHNNDQKLVANRADLHDKSDRSGDISEKSVQSDKGDAELYSYHEANGLDESGSRLKTNAHNQLLLQPEGQTAGYLQHRHEVLSCFYLCPACLILLLLLFEYLISEEVTVLLSIYKNVQRNC